LTTTEAGATTRLTALLPLLLLLAVVLVLVLVLLAWRCTGPSRTLVGTRCAGCTAASG
jgi:hypothetical protein